MRAIVIGLLLAGGAHADTSVPSPRPGIAFVELERARAELIAAQRNLLRSQELAALCTMQVPEQAKDEYRRARRECRRALSTLSTP